MMDGGFMGFGTGHWGWGFGLVFWLAVIVGLVFLVKGVSNNTSGKTQSLDKSALEILKERYARGEIDAEEFAKRKKDLEG